MLRLCRRTARFESEAPVHLWCEGAGARDLHYYNYWGKGAYFCLTEVGSVRHCGCDSRRANRVRLVPGRGVNARRGKERSRTANCLLGLGGYVIHAFQTAPSFSPAADKTLLISLSFSRSFSLSLSLKTLFFLLVFF